MGPVVTNCWQAMIFLADEFVVRSELNKCSTNLSKEHNDTSTTDTTTWRTSCHTNLKVNKGLSNKNCTTIRYVSHSVGSSSHWARVAAHTEESFLWELRMIRELQILDRECAKKDCTVLRRDFSMFGHNFQREGTEFLKDVERTATKTKRNEIVLIAVVREWKVLLRIH